jgi:hypothetical protein
MSCRSTAPLAPTRESLGLNLGALHAVVSTNMRSVAVGSPCGRRWCFPLDHVTSQPVHVERPPSYGGPRWVPVCSSGSVCPPACPRRASPSKRRGPQSNRRIAVCSSLRSFVSLCVGLQPSVFSDARRKRNCVLLRSVASLCGCLCPDLCPSGRGAQRGRQPGTWMLQTWRDLITPPAVIDSRPMAAWMPARVDSVLAPYLAPRTAR